MCRGLKTVNIRVPISASPLHFWCRRLKTVNFNTFLFCCLQSGNMFFFFCFFFSKTGRRSCPGEGIARQQLFLYVTSLIQRFRFLPAEEGRLPSLDGIMGFTHSPSPFLIRAVPRQSGEWRRPVRPSQWQFRCLFKSRGSLFQYRKGKCRLHTWTGLLKGGNRTKWNYSKQIWCLTSTEL